MLAATPFLLQSRHVPGLSGKCFHDAPPWERKLCSPCAVQSCFAVLLKPEAPWIRTKLIPLRLGASCACNHANGGGRAQADAGCARSQPRKEAPLGRRVLSDQASQRNPSDARTANADHPPRSKACETCSAVVMATWATVVGHFVDAPLDRQKAWFALGAAGKPCRTMRR